MGANAKTWYHVATPDAFFRCLQRGLAVLPHAYAILAFEFDHEKLGHEPPLPLMRRPPSHIQCRARAHPGSLWCRPRV